MTAKAMNIGSAPSFLAYFVAIGRSHTPLNRNNPLDPQILLPFSPSCELLLRPSALTKLLRHILPAARLDLPAFGDQRCL